MINIIRSVNYGLRKDTGVAISIVVMLGLPYAIVMMIAAASGAGLKEVTPSFIVGSELLGFIFAFSYVGITIISCKAMGMDGGDKTINYEIMSGHKRFKVFAGRVVSGILWGTLLILLLNSLPILVLAVFNGWGKETEPIEVIIRMLLCFFPILRICALSMMLASITGSAGKGIAAGLGVFVVFDIAESILDETCNFPTDYFFGFINILSLLIPQNSRELIIDGKPVTVFDTALNAPLVIFTIGSSLFATALYLTVSYIIFKKKDRH